MSASDLVEPGKAPARLVDIGEQARLAARRRDRILSIASPLGLLLAWELAAEARLIDVRFFPAPSSIIVKLIEPTNNDPTGLANVLIKSLGLIGVLVLIAVLFGVVTAGLMFWFRSRSL